jgi:hypothetical protein
MELPDWMKKPWFIAVAVLLVFLLFRPKSSGNSGAASVGDLAAISLQNNSMAYAYQGKVQAAAMEANARNLENWLAGYVETIKVNAAESVEKARLATSVDVEMITNATERAKLDTAINLATVQADTLEYLKFLESDAVRVNSTVQANSAAQIAGANASARVTEASYDFWGDTIGGAFDFFGGIF